MSWWQKEFEDKKWTRIKINPKTEKYLWRVLILTLVEFSFILSPSPSWTENWMQSCNRVTSLLIPCNQMFHVSSSSAMFSRSRTNKKFATTPWLSFSVRLYISREWSVKVLEKESSSSARVVRSFQALASKLREWKSQENSERNR